MYPFRNSPRTNPPPPYTPLHPLPGEQRVLDDAPYIDESPQSPKTRGLRPHEDEEHFFGVKRLRGRKRKKSVRVEQLALEIEDGS